MEDLELGQRIDEYTLIEPVGAGGFSVVWRARNEATGGQVALKFPLVEEFLSHLRQQANLSGLIEDPCVVPITHSRLTSSPPYLVMPWVDGTPLVLSSEPPGLEQMAGVVEGLERLAEVGRIMARLHDRGIIHGDLKPGNMAI